MEVIERHLVVVRDQTQVGDARRLATQVAQAAGFDEVGIGRLAIAVTEVATNLVKHGGGGEILVRELADGSHRGVGLVAVDRGPGISHMGHALRDGFSTSGTTGTGLGAIARQASFFDIYSVQSVGTALIAVFWPNNLPAPQPEFLVGGLCVPKPGQEVCGDGWAAVQDADRTVVLAVDGLGHGPQAAEASQRAQDVFRANAAQPPTAIIECIHEALRPTRGAAAAVAEGSRREQVVRFAGVGNIAATILANGATRSLISHYGTLGHQVRKIQEFQYPWPHGALLFLCSDGVVSQWTLDHYPGLQQHHPMLVAAVVCRDFRRGTDDATVVVVRNQI